MMGSASFCSLRSWVCDWPPHQSAQRARHSIPALKTNVRLLSDKTTRAKRCVHYTRNYSNAHQVYSNRFVFVGLLKTSEFYKRAIKNATRIAPIRLFESHAAGSVLFFSVLHCLIALQHAFITVNAIIMRREREAERTQTCFSMSRVPPCTEAASRIMS
jgi:hypothetical protein